jgi:hypothetical protein
MQPYYRVQTFDRAKLNSAPEFGSRVVRKSQCRAPAFPGAFCSSFVVQARSIFAPHSQSWLMVEEPSLISPDESRSAETKSSGGTLSPAYTVRDPVELVRVASDVINDSHRRPTRARHSQHGLSLNDRPKIRIYEVSLPALPTRHFPIVFQ